MDTAVLIVAAGTGSRFGAEVPKQYAKLAGIPVLRRTVKRFGRWPGLSNVQIVISPEHRALYQDAVGDLGLAPPVMGGASRRASVFNGLAALEANAPKHVFIHDAARPLLDPATLLRLRQQLERSTAAIAAIPVADTLKRARKDGAGHAAVGATVDRADLWQAQTPQAFLFADILRAHRAAAKRSDADSRFTDDAAIAEAAGIDVALAMGSADNFKITRPEDLRRAERVLAGRDADEIRTGTGYDVHAFGPGTAVTLCGVVVPHERALIGHSDADVGLHALTDAILGAIGAGDIGQHFPPSDPRWRGAASRQFLAHAGQLVGARGGRIVNADVTLICEQPKIGPHRSAMVKAIADCLGIGVDRVSVKATTTEGLGFTGRKEGIAAQAVANVALPASMGDDDE